MVPDNHAHEMFPAILLCGTKQAIIWMIFAGDHCAADRGVIVLCFLHYISRFVIFGAEIR